ncbi:MAG: hypothetical protein LBH70_02660, partial [Spirochaetaceae bacterium]|nr:hypothetical protein [Spirochaetaceae bacterium]
LANRTKFLNDARLAGYTEGKGRDLRLVFGIDSTDPSVYIPQIMTEIRRCCNNNGEIDNTGIPDFTGLMVGDYLDGIDLSAIPAGNGVRLARRGTIRTGTTESGFRRLILTRERAIRK